MVYGCDRELIVNIIEQSEVSDPAHTTIHSTQLQLNILKLPLFALVFMPNTISLPSQFSHHAIISPGFMQVIHEASRSLVMLTESAVVTWSCSPSAGVTGHAH